MQKTLIAILQTVYHFLFNCLQSTDTHTLTSHTVFISSQRPLLSETEGKWRFWLTHLYSSALTLSPSLLIKTNPWNSLLNSLWHYRSLITHTIRAWHVCVAGCVRSCPFLKNSVCTLWTSDKRSMQSTMFVFVCRCERECGLDWGHTCCVNTWRL